MSATGSEPRLARKPYTKPTCTPRTSSDLMGRFQLLQKLGRSFSAPSRPVVAVETYSGSLRSLVSAVDDAVRSAPAPVLIILNTEQAQNQAREFSDPGLNLWRISGAPEAHDIAAVLTAISVIQSQRKTAPSILRRGTNE